VHERGCSRCGIARVELGLGLCRKVGELIDIQLAGPDDHDVATLLTVRRRAPAWRSDALQPGGAVAQAPTEPADADS
jgi:hypothetical protein